MSSPFPTSVYQIKNLPRVQHLSHELDYEIFAEKTGHAQRPVPLRRGLRRVHAEAAVPGPGDRALQGRTGVGRVRHRDRRRLRVRSRAATVRSPSEVVRALDEHAGAELQVDDEAEQRRSGVRALRARGAEQDHSRRPARKPAELDLRQGVRVLRAGGRRHRQRSPDVRRRAEVQDKHGPEQPGGHVQQELEPRRRVRRPGGVRAGDEDDRVRVRGDRCVRLPDVVARQVAGGRCARKEIRNPQVRSYTRVDHVLSVEGTLFFVGRRTRQRSESENRIRYLPRLQLVADTMHAHLSRLV